MTWIRVDAAEVAELGVALAETGADLLLMGDPAADRWALGPGESGPALEELLGGWRRVRLALGGSLSELGEAVVGAGALYLDTEAGDVTQPVRRVVVTGLPPMPGNPGGVRVVADRLHATARRLDALGRVLARLRDRATWEGVAAEQFGVRLRAVVPVLDAVAARLGGAVAPLRALADALEEAQAVIGVAVRDENDADHAYAVLEDRAYALVAAGSGEDDPALLLVRHLQQEQVRVQAGARARHRGGCRAVPGGGRRLRPGAPLAERRRGAGLGALPVARRREHRRPRPRDSRARLCGGPRAAARRSGR